MHKLVSVLNRLGHSDTVQNGMIDLFGLEEASRIWEKLKERWEFTYTDRSASHLGICRWPRRGRPGIIKLHSTTMVKGRENVRDNTLLHEVAHAVDMEYELYRNTFDKNMHGVRWRRIMQAMGQRIEVKHTSISDARSEADSAVSEDLDLQRKQKREKRKANAKLAWKCTNTTCDVLVPLLRKRKRSISTFRCGKCKSRLMEVKLK